MKSYHMRCSICNRTSDSEIAGDYGEHYSGSFHDDPAGPGYLCGECHSGYEIVKTDYDVEDELKEKENE